MQQAKQYIQFYGMQPHPEGGWYKETYKSTEEIPQEALPERFTGSRSFSTAIYFLLEQGNFSAFHRIKSDECWHFYAGDPLEVFVFLPNGNLQIVQLGNEVSKGHVFQYVVAAGCWFASRPAADSKFCLVGCTVSPGFDFTDFELSKFTELSMLYPQEQKIIKELCR